MTEDLFDLAPPPDLDLDLFELAPPVGCLACALAEDDDP
jgi:hypothetical protein